MSKFIKIKGPKLKSILKFIEKKDFAMVKSGLRESSIFLKKDAQEMAPVVTGAFRKSIRRQVRGRLKKGEASATVGVALGTPAWKYPPGAATSTSHPKFVNEADGRSSWPEEATVIVSRMLSGLLNTTSVVRLPADVTSTTSIA